MKALWNGKIIAQSSNTVVVEGNHYFPPDSIDEKYFEGNHTITHCPWKGEAQYFNVVVDGKENPDAAWYYADPKPEAEHIKDHIAFWKGIEIVED